MKLFSACVLLGAASLSAGCGSQVIQGTWDRDDGGRVDVGASARDAFADAPTPRDRVEIHDAVAPDVAPAPMGNACVDAIPIALGSTSRVTPPAMMPPRERVIGCADIVAGAVPTRWFRVDVPPRTRVELTGGAGVGEFPYTMVGYTGCAAIGCAASNVGPAEGSVRTVGWPNTTDTAQTLYVALWTDAPPSAEVSLRATAAPIAPEGYCATPRHVVDGTVLSDVAPRSTGESVVPCGQTNTPATSGYPALYYSADVAAGETLFATVRSPGSRFDQLINHMSVRERCGDVACIAQGAQGVDPDRKESAVWINDGPSRAVLVTFETMYGFDLAPARLSFRVVPRAANATCEAAIALVADAPQEANLASTSPTWLPCSTAMSQQAVYYTLNVPARSTLDVTAEAIEGLLDGVAVRVLDGCAATTCLARSGSSFLAVARTTYVNVGEARSVVVVVSGDGRDGRARYLARVTARVHTR